MLGKYCSLFILISGAVCRAQVPSFSLPAVYSTSGEIRSHVTRLEKLAPANSYSLLFSVNSPGDLGPDARVAVSVVEGERVLISKTLHAGDADLYGFFRPAHAAELRVVTEGGARGPLSIADQSLAARRGREPHLAGCDAVALGQFVTGASDELEYLPLPGTSRRDTVSAPAGEHWYRFEFDSPRPKLVFFQVELMDRDDLPVDVSIFRVNGRQSSRSTSTARTRSRQPHEVQALPGNKFAPRILKQSGTYYARVRANHPEFKLRTRVYDLPPYSDPRDAVRTAVDYIMGAGDSWFANTPRRGGAFDRVAGVHQETSLCVACHASHFSQRAQLYAIANGYPVVQRQQLHFLEERFYNNPRPFYGFEKQGAVWARVISAPANVLSRISVLTSLFEQNVSGVERPAYHDRIAEYLKLYYAGLEKLPPDETNGNTPLVSAHEVAWYSWKTTHDARLPGMIAQGDVKNMVDLCYQTLALAEIDRAKYADQIRANAERILSLQRPSGQWSMRFDPKEPEVEFQTGHALWALAAAGIPADQPQVRKGIQYLLNRQQPFGGWMDPAQSFENFKTPFRETQFAVLALSTFYPLAGRAKGWDAPPPQALSTSPERLLTELDSLWERPSDNVLRQLERAAQSNEVLVRQAAVEALGRLALPATVPLLVKLLEDPSKLVQRTAAWSLRQIYGAHPETGDTRVAGRARFTERPHALGRYPCLRASFRLAGKARSSGRRARPAGQRPRSRDPPASHPRPVAGVVLERRRRSARQDRRYSCSPGSPSRSIRGSKPICAPPSTIWPTRISAICITTGSPCWPNPTTATAPFRDGSRWNHSSRSNSPACWNTGPTRRRSSCLRPWLNFLCGAAMYTILALCPRKKFAPVYSRIGNDIEQIAFFGSSAAVLSRALLPLMESSDAEMRLLARNASLIVRETTFGPVERAAGGRNETTLGASRRPHRGPRQRPQEKFDGGRHLPNHLLKRMTAVSAPLTLLLRCVAIEYFTHSTQQFLLGERLRDEVGLRSQCLTTFTHVRVARHVQSFRVRAGRSQTLCQSRARHVRHNDIRQQQMDLPCVFYSQSKTLIAVSRDEHLVARVFHYLANLLLQSWFIFDEQDGLGAASDRPVFALENRFRYFKHGGQVDPELGPVSQLTRDSNESAALPHNSVNDRKTQPGPSADCLRGKERLKDSRLRCHIHPMTGVPDHQHDVWTWARLRVQSSL